MHLPKNKLSQTVFVKTIVDGHNDDNGNWVEAEEILIATIDNANIQPKSGRERASQSGTSYDADYKLYAGTDDIVFEPGFVDLMTGNIVVDSKDKRYRIVFPGYLTTHYESDLKAEGN